MQTFKWHSSFHSSSPSLLPYHTEEARGPENRGSYLQQRDSQLKKSLQRNFLFSISSHIPGEKINLESEVLRLCEVEIKLGSDGVQSCRLSCEKTLVCMSHLFSARLGSLILPSPAEVYGFYNLVGRRNVFFLSLVKLKKKKTTMKWYMVCFL